MKAFWKYTLARLGLFLVTYIVLWAATNAVNPPQEILDPFILLAAIIVSGALSIFLLRGMREDVALQMTHRAGRRSRDVQANRDADDLD